MKKAQKAGVKAEPKRDIELLLEEYGTYHQHPSNRLINWVCIPLITFSIVGLAWSIPFPYLAFLGKYNGFLNWASFLIAFSGYYYYRLSPILSYMAILLIFVLALMVVQLEKWQMTGGPAIWPVCAVVFLLAAAGQFIAQKIEGRKVPFLLAVKSLLIGPIWLLHFICVKMGLRY